MQEQEVKEMTVTLDGKTYKESELSQEAIKYINLRSDILNTRARLMNELEKCDVMVAHYVAKIKEQVDKPVTPTMQVNKEQEKKVDGSAIANLFIDQGSTFSTSVNVKNDDETAFDLTNHTTQHKLEIVFVIYSNRFYSKYCRSTL